MKAVFFELLPPCDKKAGSEVERVLWELSRKYCRSFARSVPQSSAKAGAGVSLQVKADLEDTKNSASSKCRIALSVNGNPGLLLQLPSGILEENVKEVCSLLDKASLEYVCHYFFDELRTKQVDLPDSQNFSDENCEKCNSASFLENNHVSSNDCANDANNSSGNISNVNSVNNTSCIDNLNTISANKEYLWHIKSARVFAKMNMWPKAQECFQKAHLLKPYKAEPLYGLATCEYLNGRLITAKHLLHTILDHRTNSQRVFRFMADVCLELNENKEAEFWLLRAIGECPEDNICYRDLGWMYYDQGKIQQAQKAFEKALDQDSNDSSSLLGSASVLMYKRKYVQATDYLNEACDLDPNFALAFLHRGWCYLEAKDSRAENDFLTVCKLGTVEMRNMANYALGRLYLWQGLFSKAICCLKKSIENNPLSYFYLGEAWSSVNCFAKAGNYYRAFMRTVKNQKLPGYIVKAENSKDILIKLQNQAEERLLICAFYLNELDSICKSNNYSLRPLYVELKSAQYIMAKKLDKASMVINGAECKVNNSINLILQQSFIEECKGNFGKAELLCKKAVQMHPTSVEALLYLGNFFLGQGSYLKSRVLFEEALRHCPGNLQSLYGLGMALLKENKFSLAEPFFESLLQVMPLLNTKGHFDKRDMCLVLNRQEIVERLSQCREKKLDSKICQKDAAKNAENAGISKLWELAL